MPMTVKVTGVVWKLGPPNACLAVTTLCLPSGFEHSGHFWPTAESREQSAQIGRPQFEHASLVALSGCR
jgi:hypothetical protein